MTVSPTATPAAAAARSPESVGPVGSSASRACCCLRAATGPARQQLRRCRPLVTAAAAGRAGRPAPPPPSGARTRGAPPRPPTHRVQPMPRAARHWASREAQRSGSGRACSAAAHRFAPVPAAAAGRPRPAGHPLGHLAGPKNPGLLAGGSSLRPPQRPRGRPPRPPLSAVLPPAPWATSCPLRAGRQPPCAGSAARASASAAHLPDARACPDQQAGLHGRRRNRAQRSGTGIIAVVWVPPSCAPIPVSSSARVRSSASSLPTSGLRCCFASSTAARTSARSRLPIASSSTSGIGRGVWASEPPEPAEDASEDAAIERARLPGPAVPARGAGHAARRVCADVAACIRIVNLPFIIPGYPPGFF